MDALLAIVLFFSLAYLVYAYFKIKKNKIKGKQTESSFYPPQHQKKQPPKRRKRTVQPAKPTFSSTNPKKFNKPKDVVERLANSSYLDDTYNDEEKFINMVESHIDSDKRTQVRNALEKAVENFPERLRVDLIENNNYYLCLLEMFNNDLKNLFRLLEENTALSREINKCVDKKEIFNIIEEGLSDDFQNNGDIEFTKLRQKINPTSFWLDEAIKYFVANNQKEISETIKAFEQEKAELAFVKNAEKWIFSFFKEHQCEVESYKTKTYTVFHQKNKKSSWLVRYHPHKHNPKVETRNKEFFTVASFQDLERLKPTLKQILKNLA